MASGTRSWWLRLVVFVVVLAVSLVAAEYALRFIFRNARSSGRAGDFIARRGGGPAIVANHLGYREREIPPKEPARYRIVVVGDSFTWGQGIEAGERFSNLLEAALGSGYEVFNFGRPGDDMPEHLDALKTALSVSPDYVLLQLYINDFETREMHRPRPYPLLPESLDRQLEGASVLYGLMNQQWASLQSTLGIVDSYEQHLAKNLRDPNGSNSKLAFGMLNQFVEGARRAGVPSGAVMFPAPDALGPHGSRYPFGYLHERVMQTCAHQQIRCLDLLPAFSTIEDPRTMWVSPFDAHPNAMANKRAALLILERFRELWHH